MAASHTKSARRETDGEGTATTASTRPRRDKGDGALFQTADGRWRGYVTVERPGGGGKVRKYVSGRTRPAAKRKLDALLATVKAGAVPTSVTVGEFLASWLESERQRVRPSTWRQREQYVRTYLTPALGRIKLSDLAPRDVERMTTELQKSGRSARTAASARVILRRALGDAERDELISRNAASKAHPPRVPTRSMEAGRDYLSPDQLRVLLRSIEDHTLGPLVTVAATTGLRQGELLGLSWSDVRLDDAAPSLTVRRALARRWGGGFELAEPKTARSRRTINLPGLAVAALRRQRDAQRAARAEAGTSWQDRDDLVFTDALGQPLVGTNVSHAFTDMLRRAGLPHVAFHATRHSVATALLAAGVPLRVVADQLGHSTIVVTANVYAAVVPELRREAADAIDKVLS